MLPKPTITESRDEYFKRAMYDKAIKEEYPDIDERQKACEAFWEERKKIVAANMEKDGVERRVMVVDEMELRVSDGDNPKITGYAAKFGKWSKDLGGFREKIKVGAFDDVLGDDVRGLKNHDPNLLLGRTKSKTMKLAANKTGLRFDINTPDTNVGRDTVEEIRRGDISGCSFSFIVDTDEWKYLQDDTVERTIIKVRQLFDVGPVTYPAYPDTTVATRSLEKLKEERKGEVEDEERKAKKAEELEEKKKQDETEKRKSQREIKRKYDHAGRIINRNKSAEV
jgi:hypothetical protein